MERMQLPAWADGIELPTQQGIEAAAARIAAHIRPGAPFLSPALSEIIGARVWIKNETANPIASFKGRGALNHLLQARETRRLAEAVTSSTGNHGQGVAWAARTLGLGCTVFLPHGANPVKRRMIELFGSRIVEAGQDIDEAKEAARGYAAARGAEFVDDGESLPMIEGAGTVGREFALAVPELERIYVPMGSGTLAAGCAAAVRALNPRCAVVAVQASGAPAMVESFHRRAPVERPIATIADCLVCRVPALRALAALVAHASDAILVDDSQLLRAMRLAMVWGHVLPEPGAAAGIAAALAQREPLRDRCIGIVVTGANAQPDALQAALAQSDAAAAP